MTHALVVVVRNINIAVEDSDKERTGNQSPN